MIPFPIATAPLHGIAPELRRQIRAMHAAAVAQETPFLLHTAGIPGAGKSTFIDALAPCLADYRPVLVSFDALMTALPDYHAATDRTAAFADHEIPAREAGYLLLKMLLEKRANILFDHSAAVAAHVDLLRHAKRLGYKTAIVHIAAAMAEAQQRIGSRREQDGRHTPPAYLATRAALIAELMPQYQATADTYYAFANDAATPQIRHALLHEAAAHIRMQISASLPEGRGT